MTESSTITQFPITAGLSTEDCAALSHILALVKDDPDALSLARRATTFVGLVARGEPDDYLRIVDGQPLSDGLSPWSFSRLNDFHYLFRICPDMRRVLGLYIALECYLETDSAKDMIFHLPKVNITKSDHANQLLTIVRGNILPETPDFGLSQYDILEEVIFYEAYLEYMWQNPRTTLEEYSQKNPYITKLVFSENTERILFAAKIALFAATSDEDEDEDGYLCLTESAFDRIHRCIICRRDPVIAAQILNLDKD